WQTVRLTSARAGKATLTVLKDGSVLASGNNVDNDVYAIDASTSLPKVTAVLLEALTDPSLPQGGPGRAVNGNFALTKFRLLASLGDKPGKPVEVRLCRPRADFCQTTFGGWPVEAALDDDTKSGWSIHPRTGRPHAALFELEKPLDLRDG